MHQNLAQNCVTVPVGCTLEELWECLKKSSPSYVLDSSSKAYIWRQLLAHCTNQNVLSGLSLSLYKVPPGARPHVPQARGDVYTHPYPYSWVRDRERGVRGSCSSYGTREDVTDAVSRENLQLHQVEEKWVGQGRGM